MIFGGYTSENFGTFLDSAESVDLGGDGACTGPQTPLPFEFGTDQNMGLVDSDGNVLSCGGQLAPDRGGCVVYNKETGRQFSRKNFGLSFGLKNGLRSRFDSETCLNYPFLNIFLV